MFLYNKLFSIFAKKNYLQIIIAAVLLVMDLLQQAIKNWVL